MRYALVIESHIAISGYKEVVVTNEGDEFIVMEEPDGWVPATSSRYNKNKNFDKNVKFFSSYEEAKQFLDKWEGHPWYCKPNGNFRLIKLRPIKEIIGYKEI